MPISEPISYGDDTELRALLQQLKNMSGLSYDQLAATAWMSRGAAQNYVTKPGHRRDTKKEKLLDALGASEKVRAQALKLHRRTLPGEVDPGEAGWLARAREAQCTVWPLAEFTASEASVHTAIGRRHTGSHPYPADLGPPPYVPRAHDTALRHDIVAAAAGDLCALIVLRGTSSTGKTRSLFEAIHQLCPNWTVIRPRSAGALRRLPASRLFDRECVVWLNEPQGFLGPNGSGLSLDVLRDLYAAAPAPVVLVATLWPDKLRDATDPRDERTSDTRDLLTEHTSWVRWHDVPSTLTTDAERAAAHKAAATDPRLAHALADPDRFGFAQTLAGAHELLGHYRNAPRTARLLLEAAADARRLGHSEALTAPLLQASTLALWRDEHGSTRSPDRDWFTAALDYVTRPVRSHDGVRALIPLDDRDDPDLVNDPHKQDDAEISGYGLADYLEQHLTRTRNTRPVPDGVWKALLAHASRTEDLIALARAADLRARYGHVEALYRKAAASGDPETLRELARWLGDRPGREADAEATFREEATAGNPDALGELARWLGDRPGRETDVEATFREAATAGDPDALRGLAAWLGDRPGWETDAEALFRKAAAAGDPDALGELARWLSDRPGREADAEATFREAAAAGDLNALRGLAAWLGDRPGREPDAEATFREDAAAGNADALSNLAAWLSDRPGREADVEALFREAAAAGNFDALCQLARWLSDRLGREADAEALFREATAAGDPYALRELARWLSDRPGREDEAEAAFREAAAAGDPYALSELAAWLSDRPGGEADAEALFREAAAAGVPHALLRLSMLLDEEPARAGEADRIRRFGLDAHGGTANSNPA